MTGNDSNPFLKLAEAQMSAATKAKHRWKEARVIKSEKDAPMKPSDLMKKLEDQNRQVRNYRAWKKAEIDYMLHLHGDKWKAFTQLVRHLDFNSNVDTFLTQLDWLYGQDMPTRQIALAYVANHLINLRLKAGLAPIDDSLPGEELTLFEIIRKQLGVLTP